MAVVMVRAALPGSRMCPSSFTCSHKTFKFVKDNIVDVRVKASHRIYTTIRSVAENGANEESAPQWKWKLVIAYDGTQYSGPQIHPHDYNIKQEKIWQRPCLSQGHYNVPLLQREVVALKDEATPYPFLVSTGWQWQPKAVTVQQLIEDALTKFTRCKREELKMVAAGRTDAGVHAWGQVAHFVTPYCFEGLDLLHASLNGMLPHDIRVREVSAVHPDFHARFSARSKTYQYKAYVAPVMEPFQHRYAQHIRQPLNVAAMQEAASHFVGVHNFSAFANASPDGTIRAPIRELLRFSVVATGPQLLFEVESKAFHYKQVRNMVGLLVEVGKELVPPQVVLSILSSEDRRELAKIAHVAPSIGLYLMSVAYDEELLEPLPEMPKASFGRWQRSVVCSLA